MAAEAIIRALRDGALEGEHAPALTIEDSIHSPLSPSVFNHIIAHLFSNIFTSKSQPQGIVLVAFSRSPQFYAELLQSKANDVTSLNQWVRILDCHTDPMGWKTRLVKNGIIANPSVEIAAPVSLCENVKDLDKVFSSIVELGREFVKDKKGRFAVAIDSVSEILRHASTSSTASLLSNLRSHDQISCAVWSVHSDLHEKKTLSALEYMSSMVGIVEPISQTTTSQGSNYDNLPLMEQNFVRGKFSARFKRRNGRIRLMLEELHVEPTGIKFVPSSQDDLISQSLVPKVQFNLQLSEKERNDRAKVVLPFEHQGNGTPIQIYDGRKSLNESNRENKDYTVHKQTEDAGRGEITYFRDSDDEMPDSDEDPDDDLDI
ncbi:OLC1v1010739C1 [Oldenlandia corymbosa var. corymbosa]|uniref:Elongator complex protein 5 n=1 Tax=Oldenlandia corymbosa var. corymbosa TaxID=529605 RepID=A0AAV1DV89_OLDCO|nr:OLC1v1010739C1 [Oldenlandia corymbosa var. corymbosa]